MLYTIPGDGWQAWTGTFKEGVGREGEQLRVGVSVVTVTNLVVDGCADHRLADPAVGPTVDDLATALAELRPFVVTSPPSDVTIDGYSGTHLELTLPEMNFADCVNDELIGWDAPVLSYPFHGYLPRLIEEFSILDVEGIRLAIGLADPRLAQTAPMRAGRARLGWSDHEASGRWQGSADGDWAPAPHTRPCCQQGRGARRRR